MQHAKLTFAQAEHIANGPVSPATSQWCALRPLDGAAHIEDDGFWGERQARNRAVSIPHGIAMLEDSGALWNLRLAAGWAEGQYRLPLYRDANVYVVLEAIAWDRRHGKVEAYEQFFGATAELLAAAQADDGYLNSYVQVCRPDGRFADPEWGHELFCAGHLIQAAIADARTGGRGALLEVAVRLADYLCATLMGERSGLVEGHPEIEAALVELYRLTAEAKYLDLAVSLVERRGHCSLRPEPFGIAYFQDDVPVRDSRTVRGHAVRALYLAAGVTDCYAETGDEPLLAAVTAQWEDMVAAKTYLTGGVGSRHEGEAFGEPFELPADRAYCETCAAIGSVMWSWRMLLVTGEGRYAALIERVLFNGFAAALGVDGKSFFYVNPLLSRGDHHRQPWYETACCPPNIMRLLASLEDYIATTDRDGLQLHQFISSQIDAPVKGGHRLSVSLDTGYPWKGIARLRIHAAPADEVPISFRVPAWSQRFAVHLNGRPVETATDLKGYVTVRRPWQAGDEMTITFQMHARITEPHPAVDAIRASVAVERGPLVYCIESADLGNSAPGGIRVPGSGVVSHEVEATIGGEQLVTLALNAFEVSQPAGEWPYEDRTATPSRTGTAAAPRLVTAIPYYAWDRRGTSEMRVWIPTLELT